MHVVERKIRSTIRTGERLFTPSRSRPFTVDRVGADGIVLLLGKKEAHTPITWDCLEGVVPFLRAYGTVPISGSGKSTEVVPGTLDGYLKQHVRRLTAGWIAAVLERAGVVELVGERPQRVRLCELH